MKDEFIPYKEALELKELGFDEPCLAWYSKHSILTSDFSIGHYSYESPFYKQKDMDVQQECLAPTFSQAARYLYIKSNNKINIQLNGSDDTEELNRKIKQGIQDLRNLQNNKSNQ